MRTHSKLLLAGASLFLALPVLAADGKGTTGTISFGPAEYVKKTTTVEVKGTLRRVYVRGAAIEENYTTKDEMARPYPLIGRHYWQITAAGKTYRLDFGARKDLALLAQKLNGKTVLVAGRVEERMDMASALDKNGVAIMTRPIYWSAIVVSRLEAVQTESVRETVEIEVLATLEYRGAPQAGIWAGPHGVQPWQGYFVRANGQEYLLQLGNNAKLAEVAGKLRGQRVVVTGRLESWSNGGGCIPRIYPLIVVTDLRLAPFCCPLVP
jgi:hypothetical protein